MSYVSRSSWKRRSGSRTGYTKKADSGIRGFAFFIILLFIAFQILTSMFITSYRQESIAMEPTVPSGALLLASPLIYGAEIPFTNIKLPEIRKPKRGDLVVCTPAFHPDSAWYEKGLNSIVRFFTLQRKSFGSADYNWLHSRMLKRVIGLPGDTIKMVNFEILIKPQDKQYFFSEHEIIQTAYEISSYSVPDSLPEEFPLSGNMREITLKDDEFFVMGDNRSMSNDSYYWGPISIEHMKARAILEYFPDIILLQ
ncbi:MAG: signal peptidase I [Spirochaetales bacterium]|nr:signal peptidase I [Spirochaetales bacterium]